MAKWMGWSIQSLNMNVGVGDMHSSGTAQSITLLSPKANRYVVPVHAVHE